jgi:hypothetical protein
MAMTGFRSIPIDGHASEKAELVVVPLPFQGSKTQPPSRISADRINEVANVLENPA